VGLKHLWVLVATQRQTFLTQTSLAANQEVNRAGLIRADAD